MKLLVIALGALIGAISLSLLIKDNPGYVLIDVSHWTIQTSFTLAVVVLALTFTLLYIGIRFIVSLWSAPSGIKRWQTVRQEKRSTQHLTKGLIALAEGKWQDAERNVLKNRNEGEFALLNYLTAARAAQEQGAFERRDLYLKDAHNNMPSADVAVGLTQAELLLKQNQMEQALATLRHLQQLSPKHTQVLKNLSALYIELGDWERIIELLPTLRKRKIFPADKINQLETKAYENLLKALDPMDEKGLKDLWYRIPINVQEQQSILCSYIEMLIRQNNSDMAEALIRKALRTDWNDNLARYYGVINGADAKSQLEHAETWLNTRENSPVVLLTLGRLCLKNGLWGKARGYLQASVNAGVSSEGHYELANLLEGLGEHEEALKYFKSGLSKAPGCEGAVSFTISPQEIEQASIPPKLVKAATAGGF